MSVQKREETHILLVDDEPDNLKILYNYLTNAGFKMLIAPDGKHALHQIKDLLPDLY